MLLFKYTIAKSLGMTSCTTKALKCINLRIDAQVDKICILSCQAMENLQQELRKHANEFYALTESVALLDMVLSFTNLVASSSPDRPCTEYSMIYLFSNTTV